MSVLSVELSGIVGLSVGFSVLEITISVVLHGVREGKSHRLKEKLNTRYCKLSQKGGGPIGQSGQALS